MKVVSQRFYARKVEDKIADDIEARLYVTYNALAETFGFPMICGEREEDRFSELFASGYAAEMRDIAIRFYEEFGLPVRGDGKEF